VTFDFQYVSDSLWNLKSVQPERFASWNRFRGTVDVDFGTLIGQNGLYFHATALWQGGGNLGAYLGLLTSPSGMSSANTCRLDSWWIEKRWLSERLTVRVGQFAGQDFYGAQHYAASFIFEPMGYALGNLFTDFESFDPPSTPAMEVRVAPLHHLYVKSMVLSAVPEPFSQNPTGLVPQFNGVPMSVSEIGFTPGKNASSVRAFDNVESRKGYSGLYQFGASYNPGKFTSPTTLKPHSGNYLLYWMASQAIWRLDPKEAKGLDATFAYIYALLLATSATPVFGIAVLQVLPMLLLQPVVQYYGDTSAGTVGLVALAINLVVPAAIILLETSSSGNGAASASASSRRAQVLSGLKSGLKSPLLWGPVLGIVVVLLGVRIPKPIASCFEMIGSATSGVAVFTVGLTLAAHAFHLSKAVVLATLGRITVQTAVLFALLHLLHVQSPFAREALVCCSFPLATIVVLLAAKYKAMEAESASALLLSTLSLVVTVPIIIAISR
jgi:predicted permease